MTMDFIDATVEQTMSMVENGVSQHQILAHLVKAAEKMAGRGSVSSILVLDENGRLRNGASPHLPEDYLKAIDGLMPDAGVGTCAAAAATGKTVITLDFKDDNKWAELRHLPLALGFAGAWSMPIKNADGIVLGTFGTYFREKREPSSTEISGTQKLLVVAAEVLTQRWQD